MGGAVGRLSLDDGKTQQKVQESIWNHEAYKWRTSRELYYEHHALVVSLIGRLAWGTENANDTKAIEVIDDETSSEEEESGSEEEESGSEEEEKKEQEESSEEETEGSGGDEVETDSSDEEAEE